MVKFILPEVLVIAGNLSNRIEEGGVNEVKNNNIFDQSFVKDSKPVEDKEPVTPLEK